MTRVISVSLLALAGCTLRLGFEDEKTKVRVVSYRGDAGLEGRSIGAALAAADIDLATEEAPLRDLVVAQALDVGALASIPVFLTGDSLEGRGAAIQDDPRAHFGTELARTTPAFSEDAADRRFGAAVLVQNLGGDDAHLGPELLIGAPGRQLANPGNVIILDGDSAAFGFGTLVARLSGLDSEPEFGRSLVLGDLDGPADLFDTLAVGAPSLDADPGAVYLYRFEAGVGGKAALCDGGLPPALVLNGAALDAQLSSPLGPSFGTQLAAGELGLGGLDDRAELVITEPDAERVIVLSLEDPGADCAPLTLAQVAELPLGEAPGGLALLDEGTDAARIAVGLPAAASGAGEVALCDLASCVALETPAPAYERLGDFSLGRYGQTLLAEDLDGQNGEDLFVGAPGSRVGGQNGAGAALLLFSDGAGGFVTSGTDTVQVLADLFPENNAAFGTALAILGDISGDGLKEVAVGAPLAFAGKGEVFLYLDIDTGDFSSPF